MSNIPTSTGDKDKYGVTAEDSARLDAMTDDEITAAALADPDAQPFTVEQLAKRAPRPLSKVGRNKLRMTRDVFADAYGIPRETISAWERHELQLTPVEEAYLKLIERQPDVAQVPTLVKSAAE